MINFNRFKETETYVLMLLIFFFTTATGYLKDYFEEYLGFNDITGEFDFSVIQIDKRFFASGILACVIFFIVFKLESPYFDKILEKLFLNKFTGLKRLK